MSNEVQKSKPMTTLVSEWTNKVTGLVSRDFETCGVQFDEYSKQCAMNAMSSIFQLVKTSEIVELSNLDMSNLREIVGQVSSLKLNANAVPRECYFQIRNKKIKNRWMNVVEMGIEGDGNDALLRNYGSNVDTVYSVWLVKEGDDFTYPVHKGISVEPPTWEEKGESQRVSRVVYPVKMKDGTIEYLISERESVKVNLFAHIRNNLMNETFEIAESRFKATPKQKEQIDEKKNEIFDALRKCETLDDMLACEIARPYISAAWLDTPESMIVRKMRNNAIKKFPKNMNTMAKNSLMELDETYQANKEEIAEKENAAEFVVEGEVVAENEAEFV